MKEIIIREGRQALLPRQEIQIYSWHDEGKENVWREKDKQARNRGRVRWALEEKCEQRTREKKRKTERDEEKGISAKADYSQGAVTLRPLRDLT